MVTSWTEERDAQRPGDARVRRIPLDWRLGTRTAFLTLFGRGYRVVDFLSAGDNPRRNFYVLKREEDAR